MADNVPITAGSGTSIATDDCAGVQFQRIKLVDGTLDSTAVIPGDATNGLDVDVTRIQDVTASGTITAANANILTGVPTAGSTVAMTALPGCNTVMIHVTGTYTAVGGLNVQVTVDGSNWVIVNDVLSSGGVLTSAIPSPAVGTYTVNVAGATQIRVTSISTVTGTATIMMRASVAASMVALSAPLPAGSNNIGSVSSDSSNGTISANNSSSATLGSGAAFTGTADEITNYAAVTVYVFANVASATDGLSLQQSSDGTNWDFVDAYTVAAATGKSFHIQVAARYFRVVYTNGAGAQASFRLQTILHRITPRGSSQRPGDARSNETDMEEALAYQMVFNGTTWDRVRGTAGDVAHGVTNSGNPVQIGREAIAHGTNPTAVTAGQRTKSYANRAGIPFVMGGHPNIVTLKHTTVTTAVTDAAVITVSAGTKIVVTSFMFTLDNASTVFPTVLLGFGATNTPTTTGVIGAHGGVAAGGGFGRGDGSGIIGIGADGEDLRLTTTGNATGNGLQLVVAYYTIES